MHAETSSASMDELALPIVAVDLPSGANASSAEPFDPCVQAAVTVTFAAPKICHVFEPAARQLRRSHRRRHLHPRRRHRRRKRHAGADDAGRRAAALRAAPRRDAQGNVRPRRHRRRLARPQRRGGSRGARRDPQRRGTGHGRHRRRDRELVNAGSIESMTYSGDDVDRIPAEQRRGADRPRPARRRRAATRASAQLVAAIELPLVIDASALNAFAVARSEINPARRPRVITPHPGELARLLGSDDEGRSTPTASTPRAKRRAHHECVVVLKGHQTLIADPTATSTSIPPAIPAWPPAAWATSSAASSRRCSRAASIRSTPRSPRVYLHGFAGDCCKEEMGDTGLAAGRSRGTDPDGDQTAARNVGVSLQLAYLTHLSPNPQSSAFSPSLFRWGEGGRRPDEGRSIQRTIQRARKSPLIRLRHLLPAEKRGGRRRSIDG